MACGDPLPRGVFRLRPAQAAEPVAFPFGLGAQGVHEICEAAHGEMAALAGFALAAAEARPGAIVWIGERALGGEHGRLFQSGAGGLRKAPPAIVYIKAAKAIDTLWAAEEAIRSAAAGLVVAEVSAMDFTASRRLALASSRHGTPAICLMPYTCEGATAAVARWRVCARPSAPNRFDPRAIGHARWRAILERSRTAPRLAGRAFDVEVDDETVSLRVVSGLAADAPAPEPAWAAGAQGPSEGLRRPA